MGLDDIVRKIIESSPKLPPRSILSQLKFQTQKVESPEHPGAYFTNDLNWERRNDVIKGLCAHFSPEDKNVIRWLLKEEISFAKEIDYCYKSLKVIAFMLYKIMSVEYVPLLHQAKFDCNMDASIELDIELVFGLNKEETKQHYGAQLHHTNIIRAIEKYENRPYKERIEYITDFERHRIPYLLEDEEW